MSSIIGKLWHFGVSGNHFSASYKASDFCWQITLYFLEHLRMSLMAIFSIKFWEETAFVAPAVFLKLLFLSSMMLQRLERWFASRFRAEDNCQVYLRRETRDNEGGGWKVSGTLCQQHFFRLELWFCMIWEIPSWGSLWSETSRNGVNHCRWQPAAHQRSSLILNMMSLTTVLH